MISPIQAIKNSKMKVVKINEVNPLKMLDVNVTEVGLIRLVDF